MMIEMQFNSIAQLQRLQEIASSCDDEIFLHSLDDSVRVDAKSSSACSPWTSLSPSRWSPIPTIWPARWSISSIRWRNKNRRWPLADACFAMQKHSKIGHVPLSAARP